MIFDELAARYPGIAAAPTPYPRPRPYVAPVATAPPPCPRCAARDEPYHLIHRHLDEIAGSLHHRITTMEAMIMSALDNLNAQVDNLQQTIDQQVVPAITDLAARAAAAGVPEPAVQAVTDRLTAAIGGLSSAVSTAQAASVPSVTVPPAG